MERIFEFNATPSTMFLENIFQKGARRLYFCGYPLLDVFDENLIGNLNEFAGRSFCYELAALAMIIMRDYENTKIVHAMVTRVNEATGEVERGKHAYVECGDGMAIIDLAWFTPMPLPKAVWRQFFEGPEEVFWEYSYSEFWSNLVSLTLERKLINRATSHLFSELGYYNPIGIDLQKKMMELLPDKGYELEPYRLDDGSEITQQVIDVYMAPYDVEIPS